MKTIRVLVQKDHPAICFGQSVEILWDENHSGTHGIVRGFAVWPEGGPAKDVEAFQYEDSGKKYFNVPETAVSPTNS